VRSRFCRPETGGHKSSQGDAAQDNGTRPGRAPATARPSPLDRPHATPSSSAPPTRQGALGFFPTGAAVSSPALKAAPAWLVTPESTSPPPIAKGLLRARLIVTVSFGRLFETENGTGLSVVNFDFLPFLSTVDSTPAFDRVHSDV
jgi:hypothetical protein